MKGSAWLAEKIFYMAQNFVVKDKCFHIRLTRPNPYRYGYRVWEADYVEGCKKSCIATSEKSLADVRAKVRSWVNSNFG